MNMLLDLREKLQDTHATMAQLRRALIASPGDDGLALMAESLAQRQEDLEAAFSRAAGAQLLDVCKYRLIPETGDTFPILGISKILSTFDFGYVAPGSLEVVLTVPNDRLLLVESDLDQAVDGCDFVAG